jgi:hypothetical protein
MNRRFFGNRTLLDTPSSIIPAECIRGSHSPSLRILEPEILIVDEVLAVGDVAFQKNV